MEKRIKRTFWMKSKKSWPKRFNLQVLHLKHLQSLVAVALCIIMAFAFIGCSKDDDEPATDNLSSIIVGIWAQDDDDDIIEFNANGTGMFYESPADYDRKEVSYSFTWNLKGDWLTINIDDGNGDDDQYKLRPRKVISKDKIIWQDYDEEFSNEGMKDSFGYYRLWTWERYPL